MYLVSFYHCKCIHELLLHKAIYFDILQVDCNLCGCRNGELRCTRRKCEERKLTDRCQECLSAPQEQVCGINGVTYPSGCVATYCAGLAPFDFFNGSCPSVVG